MPFDYTKFRGRLNELAKRAGSMTRLAQKCEIAPGQMSRYISGEREPLLSNVIRIAERAEVPLMWLLAIEEDADGARAGARRKSKVAQFLERVEADAREIFEHEAGVPLADLLPAIEAEFVVDLARQALANGWYADLLRAEVVDIARERRERMLARRVTRRAGARPHVKS